MPGPAKEVQRDAAGDDVGAGVQAAIAGPKVRALLVYLRGGAPEDISTPVSSESRGNRLESRGTSGCGCMCASAPLHLQIRGGAAGIEIQALGMVFPMNGGIIVCKCQGSKRGSTRCTAAGIMLEPEIQVSPNRRAAFFTARRLPIASPLARGRRG